MANSSNADSTSYKHDYKWTRVSAEVLATTIRIEFSPCNVEEDKIPEILTEFKHEGYQEPLVIGEFEIINLTCSGKMCVDQQDSMRRCNFTVNSKDPAGK